MCHFFVIKKYSGITKKGCRKKKQSRSNNARIDDVIYNSVSIFIALLVYLTKIMNKKPNKYNCASLFISFSHIKMIIYNFYFLNIFILLSKNFAPSDILWILIGQQIICQKQYSCNFLFRFIFIIIWWLNYLLLVFHNKNLYCFIKNLPGIWKNDSQ
jgi:hypothetical protein